MDTTPTTGEACASIPDEVYEIRSSSRWDPALLADLIRKTAEGPLYDRKRFIPIIRCRKKHLASAPEDLCERISEFVRDSISLLNAARRRGEPAYMVFGVDNDWRIQACGVRYSSTQVFTREEYDNFFASKKGIERLQREITERHFKQHANTLIEDKPRDFVRYEFGWLEVDGKRVFLAYLAFDPNPSKVAYHVQNLEGEDGIWLKRTGLTANTGYTRVGDSKEPVPVADLTSLVAWTDIPYISPKGWKTYLGKLQERIDKIHEADGLRVGPDLEQVLRLEHSGDSALEHLRTFVRNPDGPNVLFLFGHGGSGKSTLLRTLTLELRSKVNDEFGEELRNEQPKAYVPIYVNLADLGNSSLATFASDMFKVAEPKGPESLHRLFSDPNIEYAILFDAFDEIYLSTMPHVARNRALQCLNELLSFAAAHPFIKIVVASRPTMMPPKRLEEYVTVYLAPLSVQQITERLKGERLPSQVETDLIRLVESNPGLQRMMGIPAMLSALAAAAHEQQLTSLGLAARAAVKAFIDRECRRLPDPQSRWNFRGQLERLAEQAWRSEQVFLSHTSRVTYLSAFINSGIIREVNRHVEFSSDLFPIVLNAERLTNDDEKFTRRIDNEINDSFEVEQHASFVRIVSNICISDVTDVQQIPGKWLYLATDPLEVLRIVIERQLQPVSNPGLISENLQRLADSSAPNAAKASLIRKLLVDASPVVTLVAANAVRNLGSLAKLLSSGEITDLLALGRNKESMEILLELAVDDYGADIGAIYSGMYQRGHEKHATLLTVLLRKMDWRAGVPHILLQYPPVGKAISREIIVVALTQLLNLKVPAPNVWMGDIRDLLRSEDHDLRKLAEQIMGDAALPSLHYDLLTVLRRRLYDARELHQARLGAPVEVVAEEPSYTGSIVLPGLAEERAEELYGD